MTADTMWVTPERFRKVGLILAQAPRTPEIEDVEKCMHAKRPLHRHHLAALLQAMVQTKGHLFAEEHELEFMIKGTLLFVKTAEWFSFGELSNELIRERSHDAVHLMSAGGIRLPYPYCIYHHTLDFGSAGPSHARGYMQAFYMLVDGRLGDMGEPPDDESRDRFGIMEFRVEYYDGLGVTFSPRLAVFCTFGLNEKGAYSVGVTANPLQLSDELMNREVNSTCDPVAVMNVIINTKNLKLERVEPSPKLNLVRKSRGRPELHPYTIVHTAQYVAAMREGIRMAREGHRTSPRPHLRRGHVRHYKENKTRWIRDTIVNASKGDWSGRDGYKVK